ncbi:MAG: hypothetical protein O3A38_03735 [Proteobacteria bacterium]|nr:hypothetical protein [Pseudomonadota bacterium]
MIRNPIKLLAGTRVRALILMAALMLPAPLAAAEQAGAIAATSDAAEDAPLILARTDSPRDTLGSFLLLGKAAESALAAYWQEQNQANAGHLLRIADELRFLIDLSQIPTALRQKTGGETITSLLDGLSRVDLPDLDDIPGTAAPGEEAVTYS